MDVDRVITSLSVTGFRGIRNCKLTDLSEINIFIGRNNSGKSSLLEALYLASAAFEFSDPFHRYPNKIEHLLNRRCKRGFKWDQVRSREILWHGYNSIKPIKIAMELTEGRKLTIELLNWHPNPMIRVGQDVIKKHLPTYEPRNLICFRPPFLAELEEETRIEIRGKHVREMQKIFREILNTALEGEGDEVTAFLKNIMLIDTSLLHEMERAERTLWSDLLKERQDKLVTQVLKQGYDTDVEDITYVPYGNIYQLAVKLPRTTIRVDDLGDGARYSMIIIMIAALAKNTAILIEEPESHQHPGGLTKSLEMLLTLVERNNIQMFASTHSFEFLKLLGVIAKEKNLEIATFFLERDKKGNVESRRIIPREVDILEKMGLDPRFLDVI